MDFYNFKLNLKFLGIKYITTRHFESSNGKWMFEIKKNKKNFYFDLYNKKNGEICYFE